MSKPARTGVPVRGALFALLLLAAGAAGGGLVYRLTRAPQASLQVDRGARQVSAHPDAAGAASEEAPSAARRIPEELPAIRLPALDGTLHSLSEFRGKLLVVNFWATWCEPCQREIPLLKDLEQKRAKDGVEVVGIALDHRDDVAKYVQTHKMRYPVLIGEKGGLEAVEALGMDTVLPFSVFADRTGRIVALKIGELHPEEATLILDRLGDLDQGRLPLAAVREQIAAGISRLNAARATEPPATQ